MCATICLYDLFIELPIAKQNPLIFIMGVICGIAFILALYFTFFRSDDFHGCFGDNAEINTGGKHG
jgi:hypothetical protein